MFRKAVQKISIFTLLASVVVFSGCKSGLMSGSNTSSPQQQPQPLAPVVVDGVRTSYADIVQKSSPAVVRIAAERKSQTNPQGQFPFGDLFRDFFPGMPQQQQRPRVERGVGSGVIVNADGTILTNFHVVEGAEKLTIQMENNKTYPAKMVGSDEPSDLAVLKIEAQEGNFPFLNLGDSNQVRVGDIVLAIGNPLGIGQTVTAGIISAKGRQTGLSDGTSFQDFLQTDAPINRGNSGGALVNVQGELIGINSQIISDSGGGGNIGIGFAIPSNMAKSVMEQLLKDGTVRRGMLGVGIQDVTEEVAKSLELKEAKGVLVNSVKPGSAADKGGIKTGDIIAAINGEPTDDSNILRNKVAGTTPGTQIKVTVYRAGKSEELNVTLDEYSVETVKKDSQNNPNNENNKQENKENQNPKLGLTLTTLTPEIARQLRLPADTQGLVVENVDEDGAAAEQGIQRGDVVTQINNQPVKTNDEASAAIEKSGSRPILLLINRQGQTRYFTVTPK
jgi:serine protease Do